MDEPLKYDVYRLEPQEEGQWQEEDKDEEEDDEQ